MTTDTLELYKSLRQAGLDDEAADAVSQTISQSIACATASKSDLSELETRLNARIDVVRAEIRADFHKLSDATTQREYLLMSRMTMVGGLLPGMFLFFRDINNIIKDVTGLY